MTDKDPMPFGKHKDKAMANVPAPYLLWIWEVRYSKVCNQHSEELCKYIHANLEVLTIEAAKSNRFLSR